MEGAHIRLYDVTGGVLTTGVTDAHGLFSVAAPSGGLPALVLSTHEGNIAIAQADPDLAATAAEVGNGTLSATVIAALLRYREHFASQRVGVVLSGGNIDLDALPFGR